MTAIKMKKKEKTVYTVEGKWQNLVTDRLLALEENNDTGN